MTHIVEEVEEDSMLLIHGRGGREVMPQPWKEGKELKICLVHKDATEVAFEGQAWLTYRHWDEGLV